MIIQEMKRTLLRDSNYGIVLATISELPIAPLLNKMLY